MIVVCPKCKVKLKIPDEKVSPEGSRFRCPKCTTVFLVKKAKKKFKELNKSLVLVAHQDDNVIKDCTDVLRAQGYEVLVSKDGIDAMVKAMKEHPFLVIIDVTLPKIYGFEVCKRIKERKETSDIKVILIGSVYDKDKYRRRPENLHGADDYIETHEIRELLIQKVKNLEAGIKPTAERKLTPSEQKAPEKPQPTAPEPSSPDEGIERARRLVKTILADILLYNPEKVKEAILNGTFQEVFSAQLNEGLKLYNMRIPEHIRKQRDIFQEELQNFLESKKREFSGQ
ncbi:MAG: response regulator [Nitrospirae bacterium]|nr:response regulator [Nitrospirota bacterium]